MAITLYTYVHSQVYVIAAAQLTCWALPKAYLAAADTQHCAAADVHNVAGQVEKLARHFGVAEDVAYTCETAAHFWLLHVLSRWEKFLAQAQKKKTSDCVKVRRSVPLLLKGAARFLMHVVTAVCVEVRGCLLLTLRLQLDAM